MNHWKGLKVTPATELWLIDVSTLSTDELWEHFEACLKVHDWYFAMSDDHRYWIAGIAQRNHLDECVKRLNDVDASRKDALLEKYRP